MRKTLLVLAILAAAISMMTSCSGNSPEAVAEKAFECVKNGDQEGLEKLFVKDFRAHGIIKKMEREHKGLKSFKRTSEPMPIMNRENLYLIHFSLMDGNKKKVNGYVNVLKCEDGTYKVEDLWDYCCSR